MSVKPIKTKIYLVRNLLVVLSATLAVFGFLLSAKTFPFFPTVDLHVLNTGELQVSVIQGLITMNHAALFLSFVFIYLHFEFYALKSALYTAINTALSIIFCFGILKLMNRYALDASNSHTDALLHDFFVFSFRSVAALSFAISLGFSSALIFATILKKMTRNYLMILRFPLASILGFSVFTFVETYITKLNELAPVSMLYEAAAPFSQFLALILGAVIPLYFLRFFLGLFRGRVINDINNDEDLDDTTKKSAVFKTSVPAEIPMQQPQQAQQLIVPQVNIATAQPLVATEMPLQIQKIPELVVQAVPAQELPVSNDDFIEHTVSKKIRFDAPGS